jgi:hypothetical protein
MQDLATTSSTAGRDGVLRGSEGNDAIYGGPGDDLELLVGGDGQRDKLYCGKGRDSDTADKVDYVSSSCEKKLPPEEKVGDGENSGPSKLPPELQEGVP